MSAWGWILGWSRPCRCIKVRPPGSAAWRLRHRGGVGAWKAAVSVRGPNLTAGGAQLVLDDHEHRVEVLLGRSGQRRAGCLPMPQLNYTTEMDNKGTVKNGSDVVVEAAQPDSAVGAGAMGKPTMEFSYDDGVTWQPAVVAQGALGQWSAKFTAPAAAQFVCGPALGTPRATRSDRRSSAPSAFGRGRGTRNRQSPGALCPRDCASRSFAAPTDPPSPGVERPCVEGANWSASHHPAPKAQVTARPQAAQFSGSCLSHRLSSLRFGSLTRPPAGLFWFEACGSACLSRLGPDLGEFFRRPAGLERIARPQLLLTHRPDEPSLSLSGRFGLVPHGRRRRVGAGLPAIGWAAVARIARQVRGALGALPGRLGPARSHRVVARGRPRRP